MLSFVNACWGMNFDSLEEQMLLLADLSPSNYGIEKVSLKDNFRTYFVRTIYFFAMDWEGTAADPVIENGDSPYIRRLMTIMERLEAGSPTFFSFSLCSTFLSVLWSIEKSSRYNSILMGTLVSTIKINASLFFVNWFHSEWYHTIEAQGEQDNVINARGEYEKVI